MTLLARAIIRTDGFEGAPGINVLHFSEGTGGGGGWSQAVVDGLYGELDGLAAALKNIGAPGTTRIVLDELAIIDHASGQTVDVRTPTMPSVAYVTASNEPGDLPRATAALVRFSTDRFINGRRLKGRMFAGPMSGQHVNDQGNFNGTVTGVLNDAFVAMTSGVGVRLAVYRRPIPADPANGTPARSGDWGDVTVVQTAEKPSYLRSRAS